MGLQELHLIISILYIFSIDHPSLLVISTNTYHYKLNLLLLL